MTGLEVERGFLLGYAVVEETNAPPAEVDEASSSVQVLVGFELTAPLLIDEDEKPPVPVGLTVVVELDAGYGTLDVAADEGNAELDVRLMDDVSDVRTPLCVDAELPVPVGVTTVEFEAVGYGAVDDSEDVSVPLSVVDDTGLPVPVGPTPLVEFATVGKGALDDSMDEDMPPETVLER